MVRLVVVVHRRAAVPAGAARPLPAGPSAAARAAAKAETGLRRAALRDRSRCLQNSRAFFNVEHDAENLGTMTMNKYA